jgi:hypothetical protein
MFVVLVVVGVFASSRGVLADWGNWSYEGGYSWSYIGGCSGWWNCEINLPGDCENLCAIHDGEVQSFNCYWNGETNQYPGEPNCWASCDCTPPM